MLERLGRGSTPAPILGATDCPDAPSLIGLIGSGTNGDPQLMMHLGRSRYLQKYAVNRSPKVRGAAVRGKARRRRISLRRVKIRSQIKPLRFMDPGDEDAPNGDNSVAAGACQRFLSGG